VSYKDGVKGALLANDEGGGFAWGNLNMAYFIKVFFGII
jgi:hypothetical protein